MFLTEYKEILIIFNTFYYGIQISQINVNLSVNQSHQEGLLNIRQFLHNFIVVINVSQSCIELLIRIFTLVSLQFGYIEHVHGDYNIVILMLLGILQENIGKIHTTKDYIVILAVIDNVY